MATATATTGSKAAKAGTEGGIGVKELAEHLRADPREVRKFLRSQDLGVGLGSRYRWPSLSDPAVKKLVKAWEQAQGE
jgi:hypothetical protein